MIFSFNGLGMDYQPCFAYCIFAGNSINSLQRG